MLSVITPGTVVPGVADNSQLSQWICDRGIVFHPRLRIGTSDLGGVGLVFDNADGAVDVEDDFEVLRIPSGVGLDYMSLLETLETLKKRDVRYGKGALEAPKEGAAPEEAPTSNGTKNASSDNADKTDSLILESQFVVAIMGILEPKSETEIVQAYLLAFCMLRSLNEGSEYHRLSPLRQHDLYLEVLLATATLPYPPSEYDDYDDFFVDRLVRLARAHKLEYQLFVDQLGHMYPAVAPLGFDQYYQLIQAVKLRSLEIPHATNQSLDFSKLLIEAEEKLDTLVDSGDFYVNVTLVPILDFANHLAGHNAYFDVDLDTDDIILKLKNEATVSPGTFEVTISYSPHESVQKFIQTYGFIPRSSDFQLFELRLPEFDSQVEHGLLMCKWMRILPQIQVVSRGDDVWLNFFNNNLPLLFIDDFAYNKGWEDEAIEDFRQYNELDDDVELDEAEILAVLKHQEEHYDVINGLGPLGITFKGRKIRSLERIIHHIAEETEEYSFDELIANTSEFVVSYAKQLVDRKPVEASEGFAAMVNEYNDWQRAVLSRLVAKAKKGEDLALPEELARDEWETLMRSQPRELQLEE